jgi:hypothetical protein
MLALPVLAAAPRRRRTNLDLVSRATGAKGTSEGQPLGCPSAA